MKPVENVSARYGSYATITHIVAAEKSLEEARSELIQAKISIPMETATDDVRFEIERMEAALYADELTVIESGDAKAWDLRSLVLRLGEAACAVPEEADSSDA